MREILEFLRDKITKLDKETEQNKHLDNKINKRLKHNQRQSSLNETKKALQFIELSAATRTTQELFIYALPTEGRIIFNATQIYSLKLITLEEIQPKTMYYLEEGIKHLRN
jgi:uncharacterized membrane protein YfhO